MEKVYNTGGLSAGKKKKMVVIPRLKLAACALTCQNLLIREIVTQDHAMCTGGDLIGVLVLLSVIWEFNKELSCVMILTINQ